MTKFEEIKQRIQDLGFTSYEAMAYVSLLENNPVTRYELSKNSGVPRSAIYNVILKLEQNGAVNAFSTEPEKYIPLPPDQLLEQLERQFHEKVEKARSLMKNFENQIVPDHLWNIIGYDNLTAKVKELIDKAKSALHLSLWKREYDAIRHELEQAAQRGVKVIVFSFTEIPFNNGSCYCYGISEKELEKFWDHKIIVIRDKEELVMGQASKQENRKTVWTNNRALIDIALNHIILDITIYGIRTNKDVRPTIVSMQNGETDYLGKLLKEINPQIRF